MANKNQAQGVPVKFAALVCLSQTTRRAQRIFNKNYYPFLAVISEISV